MNLLDALLCVRNAAAQSPQVATRQGQAALKVIDKKIQGLQRKKAWRDCRGYGRVPDHMIDPAHPLNAGIKDPCPPVFQPGFPTVVPMYSERAAREDALVSCPKCGMDREVGAECINPDCPDGFAEGRNEGPEG